MAENQHLRILLIEDSRTQVELVRANLRMGLDTSYSMQHDESLASGLKQLSQSHFDLLFLDLNVNDSSGFDTFLKAKAVAGEVPIVILTSEDDSAQAVRAVQEGAQDYIIKAEYTPETLARSARFAIERSARLHAE
ncbi:MAG: response regulator, partial [Planctomycetota bacterium]|nr:response regulator [Planctomycetota bacterium]